MPRTPIMRTLKKADMIIAEYNYTNTQYEHFGGLTKPFFSVSSFYISCANECSKLCRAVFPLLTRHVCDRQNLESFSGSSGLSMVAPRPRALWLLGEKY